MEVHKNVSFLWPPVLAAHDRKRLVAAEDLLALENLPLPTIHFCPANPINPFTLCRRQFPTKIAFLMEIRKAQGNSIVQVRIYLQSPFFPISMSK